MRRIYLDWGVVSYLKKDEYAELRDLFLSNKDRLFFVYSPAHLEDLMKSKGEPQFESDIRMLSDLAEDHLLDIDKGVVFPYRVTPVEFCRGYVDHSSKLSQDIDSFLSAIEVASIPGDNTVNQIKANLNVAFPIPPEFRSNEVFARTLPNLPESPTVKDVVESVRQFMCDMVMNPKETVAAIREEILPWGQNYLLSYIGNEFIAEHIVERHDRENDSDADFVIYKFSRRFLGVFSHGIHYLYPNGSTTLQFKLAFDNYSRFLFYDEVGMIVDTITRYFGLEGISDYESLRKKFVEGKTDVTISWRLDKGFVCVKNDEERLRPELYFVFYPNG